MTNPSSMHETGQDQSTGHPNPSPSSQWCHPAISSSIVPFSSCPQSLPASESFPMSQSFSWGGQSIGVSALASVLPKNAQDWSSLGWTNVEAKTQIFWPPHTKSWLIGKDPGAGRDWEQGERGMTEDELAGWHHRFDAHEFGWTPGWWWTGRPGVLRFMGSQRVGHDWAT